VGHDLETLGRIVAEVASALVAAGSLFVHGMPAIATFLAIIWYLINISRALRIRKDKSK
jgi:hypothetical protein